MTRDQAEQVGAEFDNIRRRIAELVNVAMPDKDHPTTPEAKAAIRGLFVEAITAHVVQAGSLAAINIHLKGIHEELVKANEPTSFIRR